MKKNSRAIPEQRFEVSRYVRFNTPLEPVERRRALEVIGCLELMVPELAVGCLGGVAAEILAHPEMEALRLMSLEQAGVPMEQLGELAFESLQRHPQCFRLLEMAMIHLTGAEQYDRVLGLYEIYAFTPWMTGNLLQTVVAAAANRGLFRMALRMGQLTAASQECPSDLLMDSQILPLWTRYAVAELDEEEAVLLDSPVFASVLNTAISGRVSSGVCPFTLKYLVPLEMKAWLVPSLDSAFRLRYDTPEAIKVRFQLWMEGRRRQCIRLLRRAMQNAKRRLKGEMRGEESHSGHLPALLPVLCDEGEDDESKPAGALPAFGKENGIRISGHSGCCGGRQDQAGRPGADLAEVS